MGASLVSVIATSSGAAAAYVREGFTNIRIGIFLEMATASGAIAGALLVTRLPTAAIGIVFGTMLVASSFLAARPRGDLVPAPSGDHLGARLRLDSSFPTFAGPRSYAVTRVRSGFALMFGAGALSGLLGIGSGAFKVIAMDRVMRIPFKVSTTTSNVMIGVTAAASAGIYLRERFIVPGLAMPVILGALAGSVAGTRILVRAESKWLRLIFGIVIAVLGIEMIYGSLSGRF
jgi:uncharacterized membrane protein YfcA